ncbi:MAG: hypothetical protein R3Y28_07830 [Candidatus Gastranaerophilales bacterium]
MGYIHCCSGLRKSNTYRLIPEEGYVAVQMDYLKRCPVCEHTVIQLTRIDANKELSIVRKTNKKAQTLFDKLKKNILYQEKEFDYSRQKSKFYLNYNEYGTIKRCYSNLSTLKLGLTENKDLKKINTQSF